MKVLVEHTIQYQTNKVSYYQVYNIKPTTLVNINHRSFLHLFFSRIDVSIVIHSPRNSRLSINSRLSHTKAEIQFATGSRDYQKKKLNQRNVSIIPFNIFRQIMKRGLSAAAPLVEAPINGRNTSGQNFQSASNWFFINSGND